MAYENVNLWFAKLENGNIVTIDEVNKDNKSKYYCPMCGSELIPKAIKENAIMSSHFAHIDKSKCSQEGMIHFWFKNKLLSKGDKFIVKTDINHEYICDEVLVEQSYTVDNKVYRPDVTIITECGTTIYFEMNYSNKKKIEDYIDIWMELGSPIVEVDVKALMNWSKDKLPEFKALFYKGKCFNVKKNDPYYNTIGKYKEEVYGDSIGIKTKERIKKLDWLWVDINKYHKGEVNIDHMVSLIDYIEDEEKEIVETILNKSRCIDLLKAYLEFKCKSIYYELLEIFKQQLGDGCEGIITTKVGYDTFYNKITGKILIHDASDNSYCSYDVLKETDIKEKIIKYIEIMVNKKKRINNLEYAKNNIVLKNVIENINNKYKSIDEGYHFYDRFGYEANLCFAYNCNTKTDFRLPEEIVRSQDYSHIEDFCNMYIDNYFNNIVPLPNKEDINILLEKLNFSFNKITINEKKKYRKKVGRKRYETTIRFEAFKYGVEYRWTAQNCIRINVCKNDISRGVSYQVEHCKYNYLYIINNGIYQMLKFTTDSRIESLKYKELLYKINNYKDLSDLESILRNKIAEDIRKDKLKSKEE